MTASTADNQRVLINPPGTEELYNTWQYSQAVRVGNIVFISGQLGIGPDGQPGNSIEEQSRYAMQNLVRILETMGATVADIVELTTFHIDIDDLPKFAAVKAELITQEFPAWTAVGVTQLALPWMLVEVKATAVCGSGGAK
jgi:enamine deaminase RidA (YjgF/YER057c/UK114 family)